MPKRQRFNKKRSKRSFTKHALRTNKKNFSPPPMRGGYRL